MRKNSCFIAYIALITLFLFSSAEAKTLNRIAAIVNDDIITELDLTKATAKKEIENKAVKRKFDRRQVINTLIDDKLFDQLVVKAKIEVSEDDLARALAGVLHENRMTLDQLKKELASKGTSYEEYKKDLEREIKRIKYVNQIIGPQVKISDQDLRDYYQRHQEMFRGRHNAHIAEIILPLEGLTTEAQFIELKDMALSIVSQARSGKSFTELAIKYSKGPNAEGGGDLGMMDLKEVPAGIAQTVREMKVGQVSNPIFANNALAIVKLISLPELSAKDFDGLRDDIYASVYDERIQETFNSYMLEERQKAYIDIR